jgi:ABC-type transport system involved in multi-copper enzyme maturation permease subunit
VSRLLSAELIKLRTTRTFYALAGAAIAISLVITVLIASLSEPTQDSVLTDVFQNDASTLFIMILAIVGITGEWRHRTITSSLLAAPDRIRFLAAKVLAFAAAGAVLSLSISVVVAIAGYAILGFRDQPTPPLGDVIELFARNAGVAALLGAFGVGVGSLIRNQATAIVAILIFTFVIDPLLASFAPAVDRFSPVGALPSAIQGLDPNDVGSPDVNFLPAIVALVVMLAWIGALFAAGGGLLRARDVE